jgi:hypothetical protein
VQHVAAELDTDPRTTYDVSPDEDIRMQHRSDEGLLTMTWRSRPTERQAQLLSARTIHANQDSGGTIVGGYEQLDSFMRSGYISPELLALAALRNHTASGVSESSAWRILRGMLANRADVIENVHPVGLAEKHQQASTTQEWHGLFLPKAELEQKPKVGADTKVAEFADFVDITYGPFASVQVIFEDRERIYELANPSASFLGLHPRMYHSLRPYRVAAGVRSWMAAKGAARRNQGALAWADGLPGVIDFKHDKAAQDFLGSGVMSELARTMRTIAEAEKNVFSQDVRDLNTALSSR